MGEGKGGGLFANHNVHRNSKDDDGPYNNPPLPHTHKHTSCLCRPQPLHAVHPLHCWRPPRCWSG